MTEIVIFTDLDGTLLDSATYSYEAAEDALRKIEASKSALVLVSSKTRTEIEPLRFRLRHQGPFIVENGGAVYIPKAYFPFSVEGAVLRGNYQVVEIGIPYARLRAALREIARSFPNDLLGFGDMSVDDVARYTNLPPADALLAKQREFDEPFVFNGNGPALEQLRRDIEGRGLRFTEGGRFYHLMGSNDKGKAVAPLLEAYRRVAQQRGHEMLTIGIGDSLNDLPMLQAVDRPVLVQKADGTYDSTIALPNLIRAPGIGPVGWNKIVLELLPTA